MVILLLTQPWWSNMFSSLANTATFLLKAFIIFALSSVFLVSQAKQSKELAELKIKPTKCVSLQQDQICFVNLEITWRASETGDYCVSSSQQNGPLQCWSSTQQGVLSQEIKMAKDIVFTLTNKEGNKVLVRTLPPLAWVYKKEKFSHSSWRIF